MKYVCLGYLEENKWQAMPQGQRDALMEECEAFTEALRRDGHLLGCEGLQSVRTAVTMRSANGKLSITDGPFAETKEQLGGLFVIEARDLNEAIRLMSRHPGMRAGGCFELRPAEVPDRVYST